MSPWASTETSIENPEIARSVVVDAFRFAGTVLGTSLGAVGLRLALDHILAISHHEGHYFGLVILSLLVGIVWFFSSLFFLTRFRSAPSKIGHDQDHGVARTVGAAICISSVLSMSLWMAVGLNDEIFESRLLPWILPLITFQDYGLGKASGFFPCRMEGSDLGCEAYKFVPTLLVANALIYFPFVLFGAFTYRKSMMARELIATYVTRSVRWAPALVATGLIALFVMHGFGRDTHDSLYLNPGIARRHFGLWELLDDVTGTIIVIVGMLVPFYTYRACRRSDRSEVAKGRTRDLTALVTVLLLALMLGNVYRVVTDWRLVVW